MAELYADHRIMRKLREGLSEEHLDGTNEDSRLTERQQRAYENLARTENFSSEITEPSLDEVLPTMGYLPPTDKRSCCRKNEQ